MSGNEEQRKICEALGTGHYSACDISDVLAKLGVPQAGFLPDIVPIPMTRPASSKPLVAPISTVLFIPNSGPQEGDLVQSNIPKDKHFTDMPAPGTVLIMQQPSALLTGVLGDIMATRLHVRGVRGVVANGRVRDIGPIGRMCATETTPSADGTSLPFTVWSKGTSTVGPALQCQAWCTDTPLTIGELVVSPGDYLYVDEVERGVVVVPRDKALQVAQMLPGFKDVDDRRVADVQKGMSINETVKHS